MLQSSALLPSQYYPVKPLPPPLIIQEGFRGSLVEHHPAPSPLFFPSALCLLVLHRRGPGPSQQPPSGWGLVADLLAPALPVWTGGPRALGELSSTIPLGRMGRRERWCCRGGPGGHSNRLSCCCNKVYFLLKASRGVCGSVGGCPGRGGACAGGAAPWRPGLRSGAGPGRAALRRRGSPASGLGRVQVGRTEGRRRGQGGRHEVLPPLRLR